MLNFIKKQTEQLTNTVGAQLSEAQFQKYYENIKNKFDLDDPSRSKDLASSTMSEKIQQIINKSDNISDDEKSFIFKYAKASPQQVSNGESLDKFAKNLIIIINSFFEYGFRTAGVNSETEASHYWELISYYFSTYSSVSYINDNLGRTHKYPERALSWLILVLNEENVLNYILNDIFSNEEFLSHYDTERTYLIRNRPDLLEISKNIYQHKLFFNSTLNKQYQEFLNQSLINQFNQINTKTPKNYQNNNSDEESENFQTDGGPASPKLSLNNATLMTSYEESKDYSEYNLRNRLQGQRQSMKRVELQRLNLFDGMELIEKQQFNANLLSPSNNENEVVFRKESLDHVDLEDNSHFDLFLLGETNMENNHEEFDSDQQSTKSIQTFTQGRSKQKNQLIGSTRPSSIKEYDIKDRRTQTLHQLKQMFDDTTQAAQISETQSEGDTSEQTTSQGFELYNRFQPIKKARRTEVPKQNHRKQRSSFDSDGQELILDKKKYSKEGFQLKFKRGLEYSAKEIQSLKNSDIVYFNEFHYLIKRKEYTYRDVQQYFSQLESIDKKTKCHNCGKELNELMTKIVKRCFCYFCIEYVCDKECLSDEKFIIPRLFNLDYDLRKRSVCQSAALFLNRNNILRIPTNHPLIALQEGLYQFMINRRRIHKIFDMIKCNAWQNIMEKNGFASEKNMVVKDFFISITTQLSDYADGELQVRIQLIQEKLLAHLHSCTTCKVSKIRCSICKVGGRFYEYEIELVGKCSLCDKQGHLSCLQYHSCNSNNKEVESPQARELKIFRYSDSD